MADKNLMSAISGLADAKPDPEKVKAAASKKTPKVVNLGKGGSFNVKKPAAGQHPHRNLGEYLHPSKATNKK
jgi:hypothetical protein